MESSRPRSVRPTGGVASVCWLLTAVVCLLPLGCNQGKQLQRDLVQRELRLQEDEIYRLEDYLEEYQRKVCHLRAENRQLLRQLADKSDGGAAPAASSPDLTNEPNGLDLPADEPQAIDPLDESPPDLPVIDFGTPTDAPPAPTEGPPPPPGEEPPLFEPATAPPAEDEAPPFVPGAASPIGPTPAVIEPEEIAPPAVSPTAYDSDEPAVFAEPRSLTPVAKAVPLPVASPQASRLGGVKIIGGPGPDGPEGQPTLLVLATPERADGQPMVFAGEASVMLRDPAAPAGLRNLARWDYTRHEVVDASGLTGRSADIEFLIGLPPGLPTGRPVELWVRLIDERGVKTLGVTTLALPDPQPATLSEPQSEPEPIASLADFSLEPRGFFEPEAEPIEPHEAFEDTISDSGWTQARQEIGRRITPVSLPDPPPLPPQPLPPAPPLTPAALVPGWHNPQAAPALPADPSPTGVRLPGGSFPGAAAPQASSIRLVTHDAPSPADQTPAAQAPPAAASLPANPWHEKGRDAEASRPLNDPGITFSP